MSPQKAKKWVYRFISLFIHIHTLFLSLILLTEEKNIYDSYLIEENIFSVCTFCCIFLQDALCKCELVNFI